MEETSITFLMCEYVGDCGFVGYVPPRLSGMIVKLFRGQVS